MNKIIYKTSFLLFFITHEAYSVHPNLLNNNNVYEDNKNHPATLKKQCLSNLVYQFTNNVSLHNENQLTKQIEETFDSLPIAYLEMFAEFTKLHAMKPVQKWFPAKHVNNKVYYFDSIGNNAFYITAGTTKHSTPLLRIYTNIRDKKGKIKYIQLGPDFIHQALFSSDGQNIIMEIKDYLKIINIYSNKTNYVGITPSCSIIGTIGRTKNLEFQYNEEDYYLATDSLLDTASPRLEGKKLIVDKFIKINQENSDKELTSEDLEPYPWFRNEEFNYVIKKQEYKEKFKHFLTLDNIFQNNKINLSHIDPSGNYIITSANNDISLWDIANEKEIQSLSFNFAGPIKKIIWNEQEIIFFIDQLNNVYAISTKALKLAITLDSICSKRTQSEKQKNNNSD